MKTSYFQFSGGLNIDVPALSISPGQVIDCRNYEAARSGGYRRIDGYERYDGHPEPSDLKLYDFETQEEYTAAIEARRAVISAVPGEGDILGIWYYKDTLYAFRNKVGGASAGMYAATSAGWTEVTTGVTLNPNGRYEFANYNFMGIIDGEKMYGCDGANKAFIYDGTTFSQITTDTATDPPDTPEHLIVYKNRLWVSVDGGVIRYSDVNNPAGSWASTYGASFIFIGDDITGFGDVPGNALAVFTRNSISVINADPADTNFNIDTYSQTAGAIEWTIQRLGYPLFMNDSGLMDLRASQVYGDFQSGTLTAQIKKLIDSKRGNESASITVNGKDQYRLFYTDGTGIEFSFNSGKMIGAMVLDYGIPIVCCSNSFTSSGEEILFFGSNDGFVYRMDYGNSFDGNEVSAWIRPAFNHFKSPEQFKRFFKVVLEIDAGGPSAIEFTPTYDYSATDLPESMEKSLTVLGAGGAWDETIWDEFFYDGPLVSSAYGYMDGIGTNLSLFIRSNLTYEKPHTIQGAIIHYSPRGIRR